MKREEVVAMLEEEKKREEYLLEERLTLLERQIERLSQSLERTRFYDYVEHLDSPRRMLWGNLMGGIAKGLGMAVGFAVLGSLLMALLTWLANANLPIIGQFIANIVEMVKVYSQ